VGGTAELEHNVKFYRWTSAALFVCLGGCTVTHDMGPLNPEMQQITLNIVPETAQCQAFEAATPTGMYDPGRKVLTVPKSRESLEILCAADGFKDKRVVLIADDNTLGPANFILGDFGPVDYFHSSYPNSVAIQRDPVNAPGLLR